MKIEETLKAHIIERYHSVRAFALKAGIPYTTVLTILNRGIDKASVNNIIKICNALNISAEALSEGKIVHRFDFGLIEPKEDPVDLNDIVSQYKWTLRNTSVEIDGHALSDRDVDTLLTALDISLNMIKENTRS